MVENERKTESSYLEEGLNLGPLLDLLLRHTFGDHTRISVDTGNQSMTKRFVSGTIVVGFDNEGLASGVTARKNKDNFALLHNLAHVEALKGFL